MSNYFVKFESFRLEDKNQNKLLKNGIHCCIKTIIFNVNRNTEKMINDNYIEIFPDKNNEIGKILIDIRKQFSNVDFIEFNY